VHARGLINPLIHGIYTWALLSSSFSLCFELISDLMVYEPILSLLSVYIFMCSRATQVTKQKDKYKYYEVYGKAFRSVFIYQNANPFFQCLMKSSHTVACISIPWNFQLIICRKIFIFACDASGITQINNKNTDFTILMLDFKSIWISIHMSIYMAWLNKYISSALFIRIKKNILTETLIIMQQKKIRNQ